MPEFLIRDYLPQDSTRAVELFYEFGYYLKDLDDKILKLIQVPEHSGEEYLPQVLKSIMDNNGVWYVLEINGRVEGFIVGVVKEITKADDPLAVPHRMGRVTELFISRDFRRRGYGTKLMDKLQEYFRSRGCYKVNLEVFAPNQEAYGFYKKMGFIDRNYDLAKVL